MPCPQNLLKYQRMQTEKVCEACNIEKPLSDFYSRKGRDTYHNRCKRCCIDGVKVVREEKTSKICKHCGIEKPLSEYQKAGGGKWLQPYCKPCDSNRKKKHHLENRERIIVKNREYYHKNKEEISRKDKEKRAAIPKRPKVYNRMPEEERKRRKSECDKRYRQLNAEKIIANKRSYQESGRATEVAKAWQAKQMSNIEFRTKKRLRGRIYVALKRGIKSESTMVLLGCTIEYFKQYFESLFTEGMTWEKYADGEIVIDHIKPCILFDLTKEDQQRECFNYKNLQPLWKIDNLKKGITYNKESHERD